MGEFYLGVIEVSTYYSSPLNHIRLYCLRDRKSDF
jgi:hypothetical protein